MPIMLEEFFTQSSFAAPDCIVVATALTDLEYLVPQAIAEAQSAHAELVFVHAIVPGQSPAEATSCNPLKADRDARLTLEMTARHVRSRGLSCKTVVRHGAVRGVVDEVLQETSAGRLLLGAQSTSSGRNCDLGSVSRQLLAHQWVPVSCVRPGSSTPANLLFTPARILYPVTNSRTEADHKKLVRDLSKYFHAELVVLHFGAENAESRRAAEPCASCPLGLWAETKRILEPCVDAEAIARVASEMNADLIVLDRPDLFQPEPGLRLIVDVLTATDCQILIGNSVTTGNNIPAQLSDPIGIHDMVC